MLCAAKTILRGWFVGYNLLGLSHILITGHQSTLFVCTKLLVQMVHLKTHWIQGRVSALITANHNPPLQTLHAGLAAAPALQGWLYFCKWPVCKCTSLLFSLVFIFFFCPVWCRLLITFAFFVPLFRLFSSPLVPSVPSSSFVRCPICCMGRGWHRWTACSRLCLSKNCWYVPLILHTYMQRVCLHYTVCVCCITPIQHVD